MKAYQAHYETVYFKKFIRSLFEEIIAKHLPFMAERKYIKKLVFVSLISSLMYYLTSLILSDFLFYASFYHTPIVFDRIQIGQIRWPLEQLRNFLANEFIRDTTSLFWIITLLYPPMAFKHSSGTWCEMTPLRISTK